MRRDWHLCVVALTLAAGCTLTACTSTGPSEHYVSPRVQGESEKINLDEVQKAFFDTQGKDFNAWMAAFEKRVNEIYDGKEVVSIDATRQNERLVVTGYIDTQNKEGFQAGDEKLFSIEQTGEAVNNDMPYRVAGGSGVTYYEGHHSILDNPILQMMLISHMMGGWGGRYYTPATRYVILRDDRTSYRATPSYGQQQASNRDFYTRYKTNSSGGLQSTNRFGSSTFSSAGSTVRNRSWSGSSSSIGSSSSSSSSSYSWGGRRSSGGLFGGGGGMRMRGWGGRRGR